MESIRLGHVDYVILIVYTLFVLGIGVVLKRHMKTSADFFLSGRSIPAWIAGLAFISANLGAQEVIGMARLRRQVRNHDQPLLLARRDPGHGVRRRLHDALLLRLPARSVPEYLKLRFDEKTRGFNAVSFAVMTVFSSGISMYALALLMGELLDWNFHFSLLVSALIVLGYVFLGGLTSAIYNEVLQFFLIVLGFLPLVILGLKDVGGWTGLVERLNQVAVNEHFAAGTWTQSWRRLGSASSIPWAWSGWGW